MRIAACVEYDGSRFSGWQRQSGGLTVQAEVERALSEVADSPVAVTCAGRTDAGVHAGGQVIHFDTDSRRSNWSWLRGTNTKLPESVALLWVTPVPESFHARYSATARHYRYVILNRPVRPTYLSRRVAWDYRDLDLEAMRQGAMALVGRHDFSAFRSSGCQAKSPIREVRRLDIGHQDEWIWIDVEADAFLHHMVRNLVGVLTAIGAGDQRPDWAHQVLESRDRTRGGATAPAHGLYLVRVDYPSGYALPDGRQACRFW